MSHLGSQLSALADGQLSAQAAENVLAHVAGCPECAAELAAARAARQVLASAFDVPVAPDLTRRLLALGATSGVPAATTRPDARRSPSRASVSRTSVPLPGARPAARPMPADCLHGDLGSGWSRPARWGSLALAGAAAASAALFVIGGLQPVVPDGQTAQALTVLGRAASDGSGSASASSPAAGPVVATGVAVESVGLAWAGAAVTAPSTVAPRGTTVAVDGWYGTADEAEVAEWLTGHGWYAPAELPPGYRITALRSPADASGGVEIDLSGPAGLIVVTQQHGRLDPVVEGRAHAETVAGVQVHLVSRAPWHAVWQSHETVVGVVAEVASDAVGQVVAGFPAAQPDDRLAARIARGWATVAGTWSP